MGRTRLVNVAMEFPGICRIVVDNGAVLSVLLDPMFGQLQKIIIDRTLVSKSHRGGTDSRDKNRIHAASFKGPFRIFTFSQSHRLAVTRVKLPLPASSALSERKGVIGVGGNTDASGVGFAVLSSLVEPLSSLQSKVDYINTCDGIGKSPAGLNSHRPYEISINSSCSLCVLWCREVLGCCDEDHEQYGLVLCTLPATGIDGKIIRHEKPSIVFKVKGPLSRCAKPSSHFSGGSAPASKTSGHTWRVDRRVLLCEFNGNVGNILYVLESEVERNSERSAEKERTYLYVYDCDPTTGLNLQTRSRICFTEGTADCDENIGMIEVAGMSRKKDLLVAVTSTNTIILWRVKQGEVFQKGCHVKIPFEGRCEKVGWHVEDAFFFVSSREGCVAFLDRCLNFLHLREAVENNSSVRQMMYDQEYMFLDFGYWIKGSMRDSEEKNCRMGIEWFETSKNSCVSDKETHSVNFLPEYTCSGCFLLVTFGNQLFCILRLDLGCFSEFSLSTHAFICEYLKDDHLNVALTLLESLDYNQKMTTFYAENLKQSFFEIADYLLRLPLTFIDGDFVDAFKRLQACAFQIDEAEIRKEVPKLWRRFVFQFLSGNLYEEAFQVACSLKAPDLLMIIYQRAKSANEFDLAGIALTKCNLMLNNKQAATTGNKAKSKTGAVATRRKSKICLPCQACLSVALI